MTRLHFTEAEQIASFNWRLQGVTTTMGDQTLFGKHLPHGTAAIAAGITKLGRDTMSFELPSTSALFLERAKLNHDSAKKYFVFKNFPRGDNSHRSPLSYNDFTSALQDRFISIVLAFIALEDFFNESIPDSYVHVSNSGTTQTKDYIERKFDVGMKFYHVLPKALDIHGEHPLIYKEKFEELKDLRNRIVHPKGIDKKSSLSEDETLRKLLVTNSFTDYTEVAYDIMIYLASYMKSPPRWLCKCPLYQ